MTPIVSAVFTYQSFKQMYVITRYTFIEYLRKKILYIILGLGVILMLGTVIMGGLALSEQTKVIRDFSLGLIEIAGLILVLFFGSNVLQQEIAQNTIYLLNSKNIKRRNILLGKFFGFSGIIRVFMVIMSLIFLGISAIYHVPFSSIHLIALLGIVIKLEVLLAICLFFSSFVSPFIALFVSLIIYFIGHSFGFVVYYVTILKKQTVAPFMERIIKGLYYIFPNFTSLSIKEFFDVPFLGKDIGPSLGFAILFHTLYITILLFFAVRIFNKKQF